MKSLVIESEHERYFVEYEGELTIDWIGGVLCVSAEPLRSFTRIDHAPLLGRMRRERERWDQAVDEVVEIVRQRMEQHQKALIDMANVEMAKEFHREPTPWWHGQQPFVKVDLKPAPWETGQHGDKCYCEACVCRNYPEIAAKHPNCRMASLDVEYRRSLLGTWPQPSRDTCPKCGAEMKQQLHCDLPGCLVGSAPICQACGFAPEWIVGSNLVLQGPRTRFKLYEVKNPEEQR